MVFNGDGDLLCSCCGRVGSEEEYNLNKDINNSICRKCYETAQKYQAETD